MPKGKWAQGIVPRHFHWIIRDRLAVCERPGGYGANHRRVRRQEEIIWIRENDFSYVVSLIPSEHNLHSYDELGLAWLHWPFPPSAEPVVALNQIYPQIQALLAEDKKLLLHLEEMSDRLAGLIAGYLRWAGLVPEPHQAIVVVERLLERQLGPTARELVTVADALARRGEDAGGDRV
jgi:hypothetical protein